MSAKYPLTLMMKTNFKTKKILIKKLYICTYKINCPRDNLIFSYKIDGLFYLHSCITITINLFPCNTTPLTTSTTTTLSTKNGSPMECNPNYVMLNMQLGMRN